LEDLFIASKLCPENSDVKKLISKINDEINLKSSSSTLKKKDKHSANVVKKHQQQPQQQHQTYIIESAPL
jgi:hypothetical protein